MQTLAELYDALSARLPHVPIDVVWDPLEVGKYVDDVLRGVHDLDWLAAEALEMANSAEEERRDSRFAEDENADDRTERRWVLSQLVARRGDTDPEVVAFRTRHLERGLIPWASVDQWIKDVIESEPQRSITVKATLPPGTRVDRDPAGSYSIDPPLSKLTGRIEFSATALEYALPEDDWVRRVGVYPEGVLGSLQRLAKSLAESYGWQPAQATIFVLCGVVPLISLIRSTTPEIRVRNGDDLAWARRIKLDIDPSASPEQVAEAFARARESMELAPLRPLSRKHLRLAEFAGVDHVDLSWAERHRMWNDEFPDWTYSEQSNFRRDAAVAQSRLLRTKAL